MLTVLYFYLLLQSVACTLPVLHARTVTGAKGLELLPSGPKEDPAVGQHTVDVQDQ